MPQSRYLFALSCYRMDLVKEAEAGNKFLLVGIFGLAKGRKITI